MQRFLLVAAAVAIALLAMNSAEARGRRGCSSCGSGGCYTTVSDGKSVQAPVQGPVKGGSPSDGGTTPPPPPPPGGAAASEAAPAATTTAAVATTNTSGTSRRLRLFRR